MISKTVLEHIRQIVPADDLFENEPMRDHTTFRVGGEAALFVRISDQEQLLRLVPFFRKLELDYFILGNGSNVLVGDKGYPGAILHLGEGMGTVTVHNDIITAGAGASLAKTAQIAAEHGLAGLEFATGIPGTVGGGIVMNAGAFAGDMAQIVEAVSIMSGNGELMELNNEAMEFGYRKSVVKNRSHIILSATLRLTPGDKEKIKQRMAALDHKRREKQPLNFPSAGSTFKRPVGKYAGKLIMDAGLRGFEIGGARVSKKHCGFIINHKNATAADILAVIEAVQEQVYNKFNVKLEPEVIYLGEF
ncbi:MAG: UDP-N-acetylmuramate dehydrogenase [Lachnospiraceae bacterium]|jgi:UDP-N-acetylmuramate dehydrogenase|nr:UDP-N-acetylmuramate dehydrogenase [Lachnospiraceae bacterium]